MDLELGGKVALVTGSSRGIGLSIAETLASEGCIVILNGRDRQSLEKSARHLGMSFVVGDMSQPAEAKRAVASIIQDKGRLDIVITNVGNGKSNLDGTEDSDEWDRMIRLNLLSATQVIDAARPALVASRGVALCISSICGVAALGGPIAYSAAKAALNSYVRGMSVLLGPHGVRINSLAPGNVIFPGSTWHEKLQNDSPAVQKMLVTHVPLQRLASPNEIANMAVFLCSCRSSFITGTVIVVDGGQVRV